MYGSLAIGADHAGYQLKENLKEFLDNREIPYRDFGTFSTENCDYPDIAIEVAQSIYNGEHLQAVLCCGSGVGMAIVANRFPGIRAVVANDIYTAVMSRRHNDANVICFGGRMIAHELAEEILQVFLNTPFEEGGRHQRRVDKMDSVTIKQKGEVNAGS